MVGAALAAQPPLTIHRTTQPSEQASEPVLAHGLMANDQDMCNLSVQNSVTPMGAAACKAVDVLSASLYAGCINKVIVNIVLT